MEKFYCEELKAQIENKWLPSMERGITDALRAGDAADVGYYRGRRDCLKMIVTALTPAGQEPVLINGYTPEEFAEFEKEHGRWEYTPEQKAQIEIDSDTPARTAEAGIDF